MKSPKKQVRRRQRSAKTTVRKEATILQAAPEHGDLVRRRKIRNK